ncbi:DUF1972 domain-containing protein [Pedobacter punctiformis]|uniref:DUF1972 domain-containing protein n=1 Tax=Pedobacter punctiformis TaxID=3004097 RepID=A0ABT4L8A0_9SPHI|nr:DUF1972 domain-containing protein [Pedobacter sp. HCMS5-2]MCZ4244156.1 DUF1972 domain-containing protein [Pedobacter sp. HCMS5-2]
MRIAILGTRGIPSQYGGFEKCAEHIALSLVERGHEVIMYNSHNHANQKVLWNGVKIVHIYDPEFKLGSLGRFIYDYRCISDLKNQNCDIILQFGYRSSPVWKIIMPKNVSLVTNMGGLEWKRSKYGPLLRKFIHLAEKLAVYNCDNLISDSLGIQSYLLKKFEKISQYIPYGAYIFNDPDEKILADFQLSKYKYDLFIGSLEPENSLEIILDGVVKAQVDRDFLVVGNRLTRNGKFLQNKYRKYANIKFLGSIYDDKGLNNLRYFSNLYFHGHTLGGTHPLLLEAMACRSLISANDNEFNRFIVGNDAMYFQTVEDITKQMLAKGKESQEYSYYLDNNAFKIKNYYSWKNIGERYERYFYDLIKNEFIQHNV